MEFDELRQLIRESSDRDFQASSGVIQEAVFPLSRADIASIVREIGVIPEDISHDSTEEKLYSKTSEIVFAKALQCVGYDVQVLRERSNAADVVARSRHHGYSMIGDAKAFRLSRTAKNAKDFKVDSMHRWRGSEDFAVLVPITNIPAASRRFTKKPSTTT